VSGSQTRPEYAGNLFASPLSDGEVASAGLVIVEWTDPGGGDDPPQFIAPLHIHHEDDEAWYVLEGALRVRVDDRDVEVPAGGALLVPRGTPHTYWNPNPTSTRYLLIMTPRIKRLIDALHADRGPGSGTMEEIFRNHRSEFIGWP
jgi:mannose-6-phosphate isomerase-like protein (cupin superfamily)